MASIHLSLKTFGTLSEDDGYPNVLSSADTSFASDGGVTESLTTTTTTVQPTENHVDDTRIAPTRETAEADGLTKKMPDAPPSPTATHRRDRLLFTLIIFLNSARLVSTVCTQFVRLGFDAAASRCRFLSHGEGASPPAKNCAVFNICVFVLSLLQYASNVLRGCLAGGVVFYQRCLSHLQQYLAVLNEPYDYPNSRPVHVWPTYAPLATFPSVYPTSVRNSHPPDVRPLQRNVVMHRMNVK